MLLEITVGVAAVFAAEPVDVLSGGIHADVGLRRGILAVIRVGELFCLELDLLIRVMGSDVARIVLALAADGAGIVIASGILAGLRVGVNTVGRPNLQGVLVGGAPVALRGGVARLLVGLDVIAGVVLDGVGDIIAALSLGFL